MAVFPPLPILYIVSAIITGGPSGQIESMETRHNDPCRCGSGKAYAQCCGRSASASAGSDEWSIAKAIQAGLEHHQAGRLSQAEALYRQVLRAEPANPD